MGSVERETAGDTAGDNASVLSHRSRQSSIARSTESIDSQLPEKGFERTGSLRKKRLNGTNSSEYGANSVMTKTRSNSNIDAAAARRAAVRQQYSANNRSRIQRSGSLRRSSEQMASRSNSIALASSRATAPAPISNSSLRSHSISVAFSPPMVISSSRSNSISSPTRVSESIMDLANKTASLTKNTAASLGIKLKSSSEERHVQFRQEQDNDDDKMSVSSSKINHQITRKNKMNGILTNKKNTYKIKSEAKEDKKHILNHEATINGNDTQTNLNKTSVKCNLEPVEDLKIRLRQIHTFLESEGVGLDLARLSALEPTLSDVTIITRYPHLTAVIFKQLVILTSGDNKEVSRISGSILSSTLTSLPFIQSMTLVNNVIKNETKEKVVAVLKRYNTLLMVTNIKLILEHKKDIMTGLIKAYDSPESCVRKASVTCLVTIHGILGENELQPFLETLSSPKRKLLSLYILRQKQQL